MTDLIRAYQPGDEASIVDLLNRSLAPYAGWVACTVDYWRWAVMARPGVDPADVLVLESEGKVLACAILGESDSALDFLVDPDQRPRRRESIAKQLVFEIEQRARARSFDMLTFSLPVSDRAVDKALREVGYVVDRSDSFSLGILNPRALLQELLTARRAVLPPMRQRTFVFELKPGQYPFLLSSCLLVELDPGARVDDISARDVPAGHCVIRLDLCALTELIFCRVSANVLFEQARLEIYPPSDAADARALLSALAIEADWHVPSYDRF